MMKRTFAGAIGFAALSSAACHSSTGSTQATPSFAAADAALRDSLVALERQSWVAWQNHDAKFWQEFLSEDHMDIGPGGITPKARIVGGVASPVCVVKSYAVDDFRFARLAPTVATLTYRAEQSTICGTNPVPSPAYVNSVYVLRGGRWLNVIFQQSAQPR